jgi:hypothetical protein
MSDTTIVDRFAPLRSEQCIAALRAGDDWPGLKGICIPESGLHDDSSLSLFSLPNPPLPHVRDRIVIVCDEDVKQRG